MIVRTRTGRVGQRDRLARVDVDLSEAPERVWEAYEIVEPHYRRLWQHRMVVRP